MREIYLPLNGPEINSMVSQNAIPSRKHLGGYNPYVFTEQGVAMLATVLNSESAIQVNIAIMRAFVKLREILSTHKELANKLKELERKIEKHDEEIKLIFDTIREVYPVRDYWLCTILTLFRLKKTNGSIQGLREIYGTA
jgi:hypothetical protein